jgi:hypothetical protein
VEGRWGSKKEANIGRAFVLEVGRDNVVGFKVEVVRRTAGEFRNRNEILKDGVEHVLELIMELEFGLVSAFEKLITEKIK